MDQIGSRSFRFLLTLALRKAQLAVALDNRGQIRESIVAYREAVETLNSVLLQTEDKDSIQKLEHFKKTYSDRIGILKAFQSSKNSLNTSSPKLNQTFTLNSSTARPTNLYNTEGNPPKILSLNKAQTVNKPLFLNKNPENSSNDLVDNRNIINSPTIRSSIDRNLSLQKLSIQSSIPPNKTNSPMRPDFISVEKTNGFGAQMKYTVSENWAQPNKNDDSELPPLYSSSNELSSRLNNLSADSSLNKSYIQSLKKSSVGSAEKFSELDLKVNSMSPNVSPLYQDNNSQSEHTFSKNLRSKSTTIDIISSKTVDSVKNDLNHFSDTIGNFDLSLGNFMNVSSTEKNLNNFAAKDSIPSNDQDPDSFNKKQNISPIARKVIRKSKTKSVHISDFYSKSSITDGNYPSFNINQKELDSIPAHNKETHKQLYTEENINNKEKVDDFSDRYYFNSRIRQSNSLQNFSRSLDNLAPNKNSELDLLDQRNDSIDSANLKGIIKHHNENFSASSSYSIHASDSGSVIINPNAEDSDLLYLSNDSYPLFEGSSEIENGEGLLMPISSIFFFNYFFDKPSLSPDKGILSNKNYTSTKEENALLGITVNSNSKKSWLQSGVRLSSIENKISAIDQLIGVFENFNKLDLPDVTYILPENSAILNKSKSPKEKNSSAAEDSSTIRSNFESFENYKTLKNKEFYLINQACKNASEILFELENSMAGIRKVLSKKLKYISPYKSTNSSIFDFQENEIESKRFNKDGYSSSKIEISTFLRSDTPDSRSIINSENAFTISDKINASNGFEASNNAIPEDLLQNSLSHHPKLFSKTDSYSQDSYENTTTNLNSQNLSSSSITSNAGPGSNIIYESQSPPKTIKTTPARFKPFGRLGKSVDKFYSSINKEKLEESSSYAILLNKFMILILNLETWLLYFAHLTLVPEIQKQFSQKKFKNSRNNESLLSKSHTLDWKNFSIKKSRKSTLVRQPATNGNGMNKIFYTLISFTILS
ncbi:hypothetical protein AYI69_g62 [Smittium culicis]|uniref:MIT domain-containing protein n=1 Tax=Smittium culicis TaxID=133412 RepID=A0A1R1YKT4_9FUNG|nr:hypothetical protein AYI69_g3023 [Smittium culicis]OMJ30393.1 hypothetical protein AYI69_g62 [Smittium culicis]